MQIPRFFFARDFSRFYDYFLTQSHKWRFFQKGEYLWKSGEPYNKIHYIISGVEMHYAEHENGHRKIISFHGAGTVFPGYRQRDYKIELSLATIAMSDMEVLEFTVPEFQKMFEANTELCENVVDWYSMYVNRFLYETAHQGYNSSLVKICNLLYLLTENQPSHSASAIEMTQDEIADILGLSRVHVARGLSELREHDIIDTRRKKIKVLDLSALIEYCSEETLPDS